MVISFELIPNQSILRKGKYFRVYLALYFSDRIERMIGMIHNNTTHPVLIKKISLKIWSLRDEIEARIQEKIEEGVDPETLNLKEIKYEYKSKSKSSNPNNVLPLNAAAQATNETPAATESENKDEASTPTAEGGENNVVAMNAAEAGSEASGEDSNVISIRIDAPKIPEDKISRGKTVLSEIRMDKMYFFCNSAFKEGQTIMVQFCIPKTFILVADVLYCRPFSLKSRIISENNYTHRTLVKFNFTREGERALMRQFLQSIEPDLSKYEKPASAKAEKEPENKKLTDLDDLGL